MKRVLIALLATAALTVCLQTARADDPPKPPQTRPTLQDGAASVLSRVRQAASDLKLSDEQKKKLESLLDKAGGDLKSTADKFKDDAQARAHEVQDVFDRLREEMRGVLSEQQRQELQRKFESLMGGSAGFLELLRQQMQKLDLTDQQKKQIDQIMADAREKFTDLRDQARAGSQEARDKILDLYAETRKKLESVLTADQLKKLQENLAPRREPASDK
jgi:Spy/CpxP family protein refolding chaperone